MRSSPPTASTYRRNVSTCVRSMPPSSSCETRFWLTFRRVASSTWVSESASRSSRRRYERTSSSIRRLCASTAARSTGRLTSIFSKLLAITVHRPSVVGCECRSGRPWSKLLHVLVTRPLHGVDQWATEPRTQIGEQLQRGDHLLVGVLVQTVQPLLDELDVDAPCHN